MVTTSHEDAAPHIEARKEAREHSLALAEREAREQALAECRDPVAIAREKADRARKTRNAKARAYELEQERLADRTKTFADTKFPDYLSLSKTRRLFVEKNHDLATQTAVRHAWKVGIGFVRGGDDLINKASVDALGAVVRSEKFDPSHPHARNFLLRAVYNEVLGKGGARDKFLRARAAGSAERTLSLSYGRRAELWTRLEDTHDVRRVPVLSAEQTQYLRLLAKLQSAESVAEVLATTKTIIRQFGGLSAPTSGRKKPRTGAGRRPAVRP